MRRDWVWLHLNSANNHLSFFSFSVFCLLFFPPWCDMDMVLRFVPRYLRLGPPLLRPQIAHYIRSTVCVEFVEWIWY